MATGVRIIKIEEYGLLIYIVLIFALISTYSLVAVTFHVGRFFKVT